MNTGICVWGYRFSFQGQEGDDEISNTKSIYDFGARIYDSRTARWFKADPLHEKFPDVSPYNFVVNNPILLIDPDGKEPRWGQLATFHQIMREMQKAISAAQVQGMGINEQFEALSNHFSLNRRYERVDGTLEDAPSSNNVKRYIYTEKVGWIDMQHFTELASKARENGVMAASLYSYASEEIQNTKVSIFGIELYNKKASGYSYEDIPSNFAGIDFWLQYGNVVENGEIGLTDAIGKYLISLGATVPEDAPNIDYIPHIINEDNMLKKMGNGLTGDDLEKAHKDVYENRTEEDRKRIKNAHETIRD